MEELLLVKLQAKNLINVTLLHGCFSRFLNCTNGTKSRNAPLYLHAYLNIFYYINWCLEPLEFQQCFSIPIKLEIKILVEIVAKFPFYY